MKTHSIAYAGALPEEGITQRNLKTSLLQVLSAAGYYLGMISLLSIWLAFLPILVLLMMAFVPVKSHS
jgi:hypothetical protein